MVDDQWHRLHDEIVQDSGDDELVPSPTDEALNHFEADFQMRLPRDYRSFIKLFRPGELAEHYLLFAPYCIGSSTFDMTQFNNNYRREFDESEVMRDSFVDPAAIRRLIFFCRTVDNDYYAWDPADGSGKSPYELPIHFLRRLGESTFIIASTFREFVLSYCLRRVLGKNQRRGQSPSSDIAQTYIVARLTPDGREALGKPPGSPHLNR